MIVYECNYAGDRMELTHEGKGIWLLQVAHSCVYTVQIRGTIQEISQQIYRKLMDSSGWKRDALMWERRAEDLAEECRKLKEELERKTNE